MLLADWKNVVRHWFSSSRRRRGAVPVVGIERLEVRSVMPASTPDVVAASELHSLDEIPQLDNNPDAFAQLYFGCFPFNAAFVSIRALDSSQRRFLMTAALFKRHEQLNFEDWRSLSDLVQEFEAARRRGGEAARRRGADVRAGFGRLHSSTGRPVAAMIADRVGPHRSEIPLGARPAAAVGRVPHAVAGTVAVI